MTFPWIPDFSSLAAIAGDTIPGTPTNLVDGVDVGLPDHAGGATGVYIGGAGSLTYPSSVANFNLATGTIKFWFKPTWNGYDNLVAVPPGLFRFNWNAAQYLQCYAYAYADPIYINLWPWFADTVLQRLSVSGQWLAGSIKANQWNKFELHWDLTQAAGACWIVCRYNNGFAHSLTWNPLTLGDPSGSPLVYIGQSGIYKASAVISGFEVYDTPQLATIPFPAYGFTAADLTTTSAPMAALFHEDGVPNDWEVYEAGHTDCAKLDDGINPGVNVMFFQRPAFEPTYPNYVPAAGEIITTAPYTASLDEYEPLFFNVYSRIALTAATCSLGAGGFTGPGTIPKSACDLRIVRPWWQAAREGNTVFDNLPDYAPGLLVYDDTFGTGTAPTANSTDGPECDTTLKNAVLPDIPVLDHCETAMSAYTSKQFMLMVKVPADAVPGVYTSTITFDATEIDPQTLTLTLTVLPYALRNHDKKIGIILNTYGGDYPNYAIQNGLDVVDTIKANIADLRKRGFNCIQMGCHQETAHVPIDGYSWAELQEAKIKAAHDEGFDIVIFDAGKESSPPSVADQGEITAIKALLDTYGFAPYFYAEDECPPSGAVYDKQLALAPYVEAAGGKFIATSSRGAHTNLSVAGHPFHGIIYGIGDSENPINKLQRGAIPLLPELDYEGVYWQHRGFRENRYRMGYLLRVSQLNMSMGWSGYRSGSGVSHEQYYNDFYDNASNRRFRPYVLSYPSMDGATFAPIPTFHFEIMREAVKDLKYLATWQYYHDRVKASHPTEAAASAAVIGDSTTGILSKYYDFYRNYYSADYRVTQTQYAADRAAIISEIHTLMTLDPSHHRSVISGVISAMYRRFRKIGGVTQ